MPKLYHHVKSSGWPRLWLMTDERIGDALLPAVRQLPPGSGVVFRHYTLPPAERRALFGAVQQLCGKRSHMLLLAGSAKLARRWGADGAHGRTRGCLSSPVHNMRERIAAQRRGAKITFVSPVFATRSHPGSPVLGRVRFGQLILKRPRAISNVDTHQRSQRSHEIVIALGGMTGKKAYSLRGFNVHGWAAIDGLTP